MVFSKLILKYLKVSPQDQKKAVPIEQIKHYLLGKNIPTSKILFPEIQMTECSATGDCLIKWVSLCYHLVGTY